MESFRYNSHVAVRSTVTHGKYWVFNETKSDMYAIGLIYHIDGNDFMVQRLERRDGRLRSYFLTETSSMVDALRAFQEV